MYIKHREPFYKSLLYHVVLCSCLPLLLYHALIIAKRIIILAARKNASIHRSAPWHERAKALKSMSLLRERNNMENAKESNASSVAYTMVVLLLLPMHATELAEHGRTQCCLVQLPVSLPLIRSSCC